jgi:hypothetical protein
MNTPDIPILIETIETLIRAAGSGINWMAQVSRANVSRSTRGILNNDLQMSTTAIQKARLVIAPWITPAPPLPNPPPRPPAPPAEPPPKKERVIFEPIPAWVAAPEENVRAQSQIDLTSLIEQFIRASTASLAWMQQMTLITRLPSNHIGLAADIKLTNSAISKGQQYLDNHKLLMGEQKMQ